MNENVSVEQLREFFLWLVTPETENKKKKFHDENMVDDYIELTKNIDIMGKDALIIAIDRQLHPYALEINKDFEHTALYPVPIPTYLS